MSSGLPSGVATVGRSEVLTEGGRVVVVVVVVVVLVVVVVARVVGGEVDAGATWASAAQAVPRRRVRATTPFVVLRYLCRIMR